MYNSFCGPTHTHPAIGPVNWLKDKWINQRSKSCLFGRRPDSQDEIKRKSKKKKEWTVQQHPLLFSLLWSFHQSLWPDDNNNRWEVATIGPCQKKRYATTPFREFQLQQPLTRSRTMRTTENKRDSESASSSYSPAQPPIYSNSTPSPPVMNYRSIQPNCRPN